MATYFNELHKTKSQGIKAFQKSKPTCEDCGKSDYFLYKNIRRAGPNACEIYCGHCGKGAMYFHYIKS